MISMGREGRVGTGKLGIIESQLLRLLRQEANWRQQLVFDERMS